MATVYSVNLMETARESRFDIIGDIDDIWVSYLCYLIKNTLISNLNYEHLRNMNIIYLVSFK